MFQSSRCLMIIGNYPTQYIEDYHSCLPTCRFCRCPFQTRGIHDLQLAFQSFQAGWEGARESAWEIQEKGPGGARKIEHAWGISPTISINLQWYQELKTSGFIDRIQELIMWTWFWDLWFVMSTQDFSHPMVYFHRGVSHPRWSSWLQVDFTDLAALLAVGSLGP